MRRARSRQAEYAPVSESTSGQRSRLTEPSVADQAHVLVELGLSGIAAMAGILAIVQRERADG